MTDKPIPLSKSIQTACEELYRLIQEDKSTQDLVVVVGKRSANLRALEVSQLGYTEENVIFEIRNKSTESTDPGQVIIFTTDGSDPAVQRWGTITKPRVIISTDPWRGTGGKKKSERWKKGWREKKRVLLL